MINERKLRKNRLDRQRRINRRKRNTKIKLVTMLLVLSISVASWYVASFSVRNANADTAEILSKNNSEKNISAEGYSDTAISYKKVLKDISLFEEISENHKVSLNIREGEYIRYLGEKGAWAKVQHKGYTGYVKSNSLESVKNNELKIVKDLLIVTHRYIIPRDFETRFSVEAESSMMVMLEAMRREDLNISVGTRYLDSKNIDESSIYPDLEHNELRTGEAVEFITSDGLSLENTKEGNWLLENSYKYGFILRYPRDKEEITKFDYNMNIYRYVGTENATIMYKNNLSVEEYFDK